MKLISVKESLPPIEHDVLMLCKFNGWNKAWIGRDGLWFDGDFTYETENITHWMELPPEPPKEQGK